MEGGFVFFSLFCSLLHLTDCVGNAVTASLIYVSIELSSKIIPAKGVAVLPLQHSNIAQTPYTQLELDMNRTNTR